MGASKINIHQARMDRAFEEIEKLPDSKREALFEKLFETFCTDCGTHLDDDGDCPNECDPSADLEDDEDDEDEDGGDDGDPEDDEDEDDADEEDDDDDDDTDA